MLVRLGGSTNRASAAPTTLVVGVSDPIAPLAEQEATRIAETIAERGARPVLLVAGEAVRDRFLGPSSVGFVHIATHARFNVAEPLASGVRMADGWLTVRDILAARLEDAVVTLSACESGRSAVGSGDELQGFIRGLLVAGARAVLTSHWPVHDQSTTELMASVYTGGVLEGPTW